MIKSIDDKLQLWARWRALGCSNESQYAWARLITENDVWTEQRGARIPVDALECANVEKCIMALDPVLRVAVEEQYRYTNQPEEKATRCRCSRMTFYRRIDRAHRQIEIMLRDQAVNGIDPQAWSQAA